MKLAVATFVLVLLSACATDGGVTIKEVKVPVPVPCKVEEPAAPAYRFTPPYDDIFSATRDLMGDRELANAYENELRIALKACK